MGDYLRWRDALKDWVQGSTGLVAIWENEPRPARLEKPMAILSGPHSVEQDSPDWLTWADGVPTVVAPRRLMFSLRVVNRTQTPDVRAQRYVELARMSLALPATRRLLKAAMLAYVRASTIKQMDVEYDDRMESVASLDLWFNGHMDTEAPTGVDEGTIETVGITSEFGANVDVTDELLDPEA